MTMKILSIFLAVLAVAMESTNAKKVCKDKCLRLDSLFVHFYQDVLLMFPIVVPTYKKSRPVQILAANAIA